MTPPMDSKTIADQLCQFARTNFAAEGANFDEHSPLAGMTAADLERLQVEFLILIKGFDDTFGQTVHARYSYRHDELLWGGRFAPAFDVDPRGDLVLDPDKVGALAPAESSP